MTYRIVLTLLAVASLVAALAAIDAVLSWWWNPDMTRKQQQRREPWGKP